MNKKVVIPVLLLVATIFVANFAYAAGSAPDPSTIITNIQNFFSPLFGTIFGQTTNIFELLLFALIIIAATYMALSRVDIIRSNSFALWAITIAVAVLATRYIGTTGGVQALLFPQGVFGVAIISIIPFILYFWFVEFGIASKAVRNLAWIMYAVVFAFLWYKQFGITTDANLAQWGYMYLGFAGLAIICLIADGTIRRAIKKVSYENERETRKDVLSAKIMKQIEELQDLLSSSGVTEPQRKSIEKKIEVLEKRLDRTSRY